MAYLIFLNYLNDEFDLQKTRFENIYINRNGNLIYDKKTNKQIKILNTGRNNYKIIRLPSRFKYFETRKNYQVSYLVYETFTKEIIDTEKYQIHHINLDQTDNRLMNLIKLTKTQHREIHKLLKKI